MVDGDSQKHRAESRSWLFRTRQCRFPTDRRFPFSRSWWRLPCTSAPKAPLLMAGRCWDTQPTLPISPMITSIVPLKTILLQTLFLLVAIAIESSFLYEFLQYPRKTSLEYAIPMNLFSTIISWFLFFTFVPIASKNFQTELMNFIFLNEVSESLYFFLIFSFSTLFIVRTIVKLFTFNFLERIKKLSFELKINLHKKSEPIFTKKIKPKRKNRVIIWGHSCSETTILLILFLINWNSQWTESLTP